MFVQWHVHFVQNALRTAFHTLPASLALVRVKPDMCRFLCHTAPSVAESVMRNDVRRRQKRKGPHGNQMNDKPCLSTVDMQYKATDDGCGQQDYHDGASSFHRMAE